MWFACLCDTPTQTKVAPVIADVLREHIRILEALEASGCRIMAGATSAEHIHHVVQATLATTRTKHVIENVLLRQEVMQTCIESTREVLRNTDIIAAMRHLIDEGESPLQVSMEQVAPLEQVASLEQVAPLEPTERPGKSTTDRYNMEMNAA